MSEVLNSYRKFIMPLVFSYDMLVNRNRRLSEDFKPESLILPQIPFDSSAAPDDPKRMLESEAAHAAESLFIQSRHDGLHLYGVSGYRTYSRQNELFSRNPETIYVAPPGGSEHQTGLALDVSCPALSMDLTEEFALTLEGRWLTKNAPLFGFILRYPKGKENITGYAYEPWHIRYVTRSLAIYLTLTGLTLEEYHSLRLPDEDSEDYGCAASSEPF